MWRHRGESWAVALGRVNSADNRGARRSYLSLWLPRVNRMRSCRQIIATSWYFAARGSIILLRPWPGLTSSRALTSPKDSRRDTSRFTAFRSRLSVAASSETGAGFSRTAWITRTRSADSTRTRSAGSSKVMVISDASLSRRSIFRARSSDRPMNASTDPDETVTRGDVLLAGFVTFFIFFPPELLDLKNQAGHKGAQSGWLSSRYRPRDNCPEHGIEVRINARSFISKPRNLLVPTVQSVVLWLQQGTNVRTLSQIAVSKLLGSGLPPLLAYSRWRPSPGRPTVSAISKTTASECRCCVVNCSWDRGCPRCWRTAWKRVWLPGMDSNHDSRLQRPLSYH
jgi:hypothetical protein